MQKATLVEPADRIRRDIFSVKEYDPTQVGWCHVYMTKDRQKALNKARDVRNNHTLGIRRQAKIVHPAQWVVDGYVAAGNAID